MDIDHELRCLRERVAELFRLADDDGVPTQGTSSILLQTKTVGTYPTAAQRFYACDVVTPGGTESEGSTGSFTTATGTVFGLNVGDQVPPSGTMVLAESVAGRYIFNFSG